MADQKMDQVTGLDQLAKLFQMFGGTKTSETTSGNNNFSQTEQTNLSPAAMQALLRTALESTQGLSAVAQGQRGAGLYGSSTNRLMTNDLLSRLTAQAATQGASKTISRSGPASTRITKAGGASENLQKAMLGLAIYQKLTGKNPMDQIGKVTGNVYDQVAAALPSMGFGSDTAVNFAGADIPTQMDFGLMADASPFGFSDMSVGANVNASLGDSLGFMTLSPSDYSVINNAVVPSAGEFTVPTEEEYYSNFTNAPAASTASTASNTGAAGAVSGINASGLGSSAYSLYKGISALTDSNSKNDAAGVVSTASGAQGAYKAYDTYQSAAKAAEVANQTNAAEGISSTYTASDYGGGLTSGFEAGSGSTLGYVGPVLSAFNAPNNPEGAQNKDYRHAVGSAILNYFGAGWASPIVHEIAQPVLNATTDAGEESLGVAGAVAADPVGALISGEYEFGDVMTSGLDPANIFGGNPGGSIGSVVAAGVDPVGAMLGDKGVFSEVKDFVDNLNPFGGGGGGGCFITTAVMVNTSENFNDNCEELTILRNFRDGYLAALPNGTALIQEYYQIAPRIVSQILSRADSQEIWHKLHKYYIAPAVAFAKSGANEEAFNTYTDMISWLQQLIKEE